MKTLDLQGFKLLDVFSYLGVIPIAIPAIVIAVPEADPAADTTFTSDPHLISRAAVIAPVASPTSTTFAYPLAVDCSFLACPVVAYDVELAFVTLLHATLTVDQIIYMT